MANDLNSIFSKLRNFDAYPKTLEDFRIKTFAGATVTIISSAIMIFLFLSELRYYLTTDVMDELFVDMSRGDKIKINVDVTFHYLPCAYVALDAMDVSGQRQINVHTTLYKQRLAKDGTVVTESEIVVLEDIRPKSNKTVPGVNECGSCYGAETVDLKCCNTCDDVRAAYNKKGWAFPKGNIVKQCENEQLKETLELQSGEGCRLHGYLEVNRVAGNFHVSPGKSYEMGHMHVHDMAAFGSGAKYNLTHTINHLSFGDNYPGQIFPLDNHYVYAEAVEMVFQYYLKIVPTTYIKLSGDKLKTNQFSVTKHQKQLSSSGAETSLPGLFVSYELSPMMVRYTEKRRSFFHFLTSVCAIIGGVFTVAGLIDSFIYHGGRALQRKIELGKTT
uniref:endoplasmic reticulum-Golgi intermediate compartment protein 3-like n=1 Tax=Styela clava TaxID=7725 RepID=UPI00193A5AB0|nr:endoplasmic reticulum-Golgi intermediate compartment protein 3-like [Styela clava]